MTFPTPRDAAEALVKQLLHENAHQGFKDSFREKIERVIAARDRAVLADDEATIEAMARAAQKQFLEETTEDAIHFGLMCKLQRAALADLRRLRGVEERRITSDGASENDP